MKESDFRVLIRLMLDFLMHKRQRLVIVFSLIALNTSLVIIRGVWQSDYLGTGVTIIVFPLMIALLLWNAGWGLALLEYNRETPFEHAFYRLIYLLVFFLLDIYVFVFMSWESSSLIG